MYCTLESAHSRPAERNRNFLSKSLILALSATSFISFSLKFSDLGFQTPKLFSSTDAQIFPKLSAIRSKFLIVHQGKHLNGAFPQHLVGLLPIQSFKNEFFPKKIYRQVLWAWEPCKLSAGSRVEFASLTCRGRASRLYLYITRVIYSMRCVSRKRHQAHLRRLTNKSNRLSYWSLKFANSRSLDCNESYFP